MTRSVTPRPTLLGASLVVAFVLAACSSGSGATIGPTSAAPASAASCAVGTAAATVVVSIKGFAFSPDTIAVKVGDVIGWTNGDSVTHTATLDDGSCDAGRIAGGSAGTQTFVFGAGAVGKSFAYHCAIHGSMKGTITVTS